MRLRPTTATTTSAAASASARRAPGPAGALGSQEGRRKVESAGDGGVAAGEREGPGPGDQGDDEVRARPPDDQFGQRVQTGGATGCRREQDRVQGPPAPSEGRAAEHGQGQDDDQAPQPGRGPQRACEPGLGVLPEGERDGPIERGQLVGGLHPPGQQHDGEKQQRDRREPQGETPPRDFTPRRRPGVGRASGSRRWSGVGRGPQQAAREQTEDDAGGHQGQREDGEHPVILSKSGREVEAFAILRIGRAGGSERAGGAPSRRPESRREGAPPHLTMPLSRYPNRTLKRRSVRPRRRRSAVPSAAAVAG